MSSSEMTTVNKERAPFFVGVTGYTELKKDEVEPLRERLSRLFQFLRDGAKDETLEKLLDDLVPDKKEKNLRHEYRGALSGWTGLSRETPIVVFSSLAPGLDTLVANVVLDQSERDHLELRCPLPFPAHIYCGSRTFVRLQKGKPAPDNLKRQKDFLGVLAKMGAIEEEAVDMATGTASLPADLKKALKDIPADKLKKVFSVRLKEDSEFEYDTDRHVEKATNWKEQLKLEADDRERQLKRDGANEARCRERCYAAGEFLTVSAHLMIAVWNGERDDGLFGPSAVVEARLLGPRLKVLPTTSKLPLQHGGPLWHLRAARTDGPDANLESCAETQHASLPPLRLLHPYTVAGRDCPGAPIVGAGQARNTELQTERLRLLARMGENLSNFNSRRVPKRENREAEYRKKFTDSGLAECLERESPPLAAGLRRVSGFACRGSELTDYYQGKFKRTLAQLFWLTLFAAIALHFSAHWHSRDPKAKKENSQPKGHVEKSHQDYADHYSAVQIRFGWTSLLLAAGAVGFFAWQRSRKLEPHGHDTRAIAEGLRVQFFWNLAGLGKSVSANYMSRHRSELDWIRGVIRETSTPYHPWKEYFTKLPLRSQAQAFRAVQSGWVRDQLNYFRNASHRELHRLHKWHKFGGVVALAGVLTFLKLISRDSWPSVGRFFELVCHAWVALPLLIIAGGWSWYLAYRDAVRKAASSRDNSVTIFPDLKKVFVNAWKVARSIWKDPPVKGTVDALQRLCIWSFVWVTLPFFVALELVSIFVPTHHDSAMTQTDFWRRLRHGTCSFLAHLPLALAIACVVHFLCAWVSICYDTAPSFLALGIIGGGVLLVVGALSVAWAEKNFHSELAYQYSTMTGLFDAADARLDKELANFEATIEENGKSKGELADARKEQDELIKHIQGLLFKLGQEALDENAEWLLLHRARPLEPVFAG